MQWCLTIYDSREDFNNKRGQRSYQPTENAAHSYMRGYGEYFDYDVEPVK